MVKRGWTLLLAALLAAGLLSGCGAGAPSQGGSSAAQIQTSPVESAAPDTDQVASAGEMTAVEEVEEPGMEPVYPGALKDGVYPVEMKSSSSMFKVDHVTLTVERGAMRAQLYMTSGAYLCMYPGTAAEAAAAPETEYVPLAPAEEGMEAFELPVEALDTGLSYAAFSKNKEKWYDRTLLFRADSLPEEAFLEGRGTSPETLGLADGTYTAAVTLAGGSGRASVESPARLTIQGGLVTATIVWGSTNYDYMMVDGQRYDPAEGTEYSTFEIPVARFDAPLAVQADTTAMSQPYLIDYTLTFDSATLAPAA